MTTSTAVMDSRELRDLLNAAAPMRVLDVRTPGEFQTAHIAGSYNVPLDLLQEHRLVAGSVVLTSVLGSIAMPKLKWVAAAIGGGLTVAALTNTCAMGMALAKLPYNRGASCDAESVVSQLVSSTPAQRSKAG